MQRMLKAISACLIVCASLPAVGGGRRRAVPRAAKSAPSVRLPGPAFVALETINPEHIRWHVRYLVA